MTALIAGMIVGSVGGALWVILGIVWLILLITLGIMSIRRGHWVMFLIGTVLPRLLDHRSAASAAPAQLTLNQVPWAEALGETLQSSAGRRRGRRARSAVVASGTRTQAESPGGMCPVDGGMGVQGHLPDQPEAHLVG